MSDYKILISSRAQKDFNKLDHKIQNRVTKAILKIKKNRYPQQFKSLKGIDIAQYRLRVGDWRILYDVYDDTKSVLILRIGHRKEIYK